MATKRNRKGFSKKQVQAAEMLVNPDFRGSVTEICETIGVARSTLYRWLADSAYCRYLDELIDKFTDSELANVWKALIRRAVNGNVEAQKLYFELKGKYKQQLDINGGVVFISGEDEISE